MCPRPHSIEGDPDRIDASPRDRENGSREGLGAVGYFTTMRLLFIFHNLYIKRSCLGMTGSRHSLVLHTLLHYKDPNIYIGHSSRSWASSLRCACLFCEVEPTLWAPKLSSIRTSFAQYVLLICIFMGRLVASRQSLFFQ